MYALFFFFILGWLVFSKDGRKAIGFIIKGFFLYILLMIGLLFLITL